MAKRRLSNSDGSSEGQASDENESYSAKLRPINDLRRPDRWTYQERRMSKKGKGKASRGKKATAKRRAKAAVQTRDLYAANLYTWIRRPKFLETKSSLDNVSGGVSLPTPALDAFPGSSAKAVVPIPILQDAHDANIFDRLEDEMRSILTSMYVESPPANMCIPTWFWGHLRPCDRFLLLKRLFVVDLFSVNGNVINAIPRPDFSDAKKIVRNLKQLHIVVSPDPERTNAMKTPNICARIVEIHDLVRHPRRTRVLQEAKHFYVAVDGQNNGCLNICLSGDHFHLKLRTDEHNFSRFTGQYEKVVFPSVRAYFRAEACMEDSLTRDADYLESKRISIRKSFQAIVAY